VTTGGANDRQIAPSPTPREGAVASGLCVRVQEGRRRQAVRMRKTAKIPIDRMVGHPNAKWNTLGKIALFQSAGK
jgi:hypothetical protein